MGRERERERERGRERGVEREVEREGYERGGGEGGAFCEETRWEVVEGCLAKNFAKTNMSFAYVM